MILSHLLALRFQVKNGSPLRVIEARRSVERTQEEGREQQTRRSLQPQTPAHLANNFDFFLVRPQTE